MLKQKKEGLNMNIDEKMIEKLKNNERPLFVLMRDEPEMVEALNELWKDLEWRQMGEWGKSGHKLDKRYDSNTYRLRPDYNPPKKERWFVYTGQNERNGNLCNEEILSVIPIWLEIKTDEELAYCRNRPDGCRLGAPCLLSDTWFDIDRNEVSDAYITDGFLSGYRWIKEKKEPKFVEYPIIQRRGIYFVTGIPNTDTNNGIALHKVTCRVGFAGVQFNGQKENSWNMVINRYIYKGDLYSGGILGADIATPIKARFLVEVEK
jgi:hypothetical protein